MCLLGHERAEGIRIGDLLQKGCSMGALVSRIDWGLKEAWLCFEHKRAFASVTRRRRAAAWAR